jgi:hypothetical protein
VFYHCCQSGFYPEIPCKLNPNFSVEKFAPGDDDPQPYGQDAMVNPDLQIVLQFVASAAVADFAFHLQNPG